MIKNNEYAIGELRMYFIFVWHKCHNIEARVSVHYQLLATNTMFTVKAFWWMFYGKILLKFKYNLHLSWIRKGWMYLTLTNCIMFIMLAWVVQLYSLSGPNIKLDDIEINVLPAQESRPKVPSCPTYLAVPSQTISPLFASTRKTDLVNNSSLFVVGNLVMNSFALIE